jgi:hypothetical protein
MAQQLVGSLCNNVGKETFTKVGHQMGDPIYSVGPSCFRKHVKTLVLVVFVVVTQCATALGPRGGLWPVSVVYVLLSIRMACA